MSAKLFVKRLLLGASRVAGIDKIAVLQGEIRAEQIRARGRLDCLSDAEFSVFSQWGEDGIIDWLVHAIQPKSDKFVEFGVEDYRESNTRFLMLSRYWAGLIIDGGMEYIQAIRRDINSYKYDLQSTCSFITRDNIQSLIDDAKLGERLGLLSVDIDGVDYWVLERISNPCDIVIVEYNDALGDKPVSVPYDPSFRRLERHWSGMYWGASLSAFRHLLEGRGYVFVGTNRAGTNAFFVAGEHRSAVEAGLQTMKAWPCRMREVRNQDGSLALLRYADRMEVLDPLPFVDVATGQSMTGADLFL